MRRRSEELLKRLHSTVDPEEMVSALSVAEKQMVEIAKAFLEDSRILIMDEPTTVLNRDETEILFGIMREFTERGGSVIYISHKLDEVREICDEVVVLRDGVLVADRDAKKVSSRELAELMVGRELSQVFPPKQKVPEDAPETLRVENLSSGKAVRNVSFVLHRGEILGMAGLAGAGRTEVAETICALRRRTGGKIFVHGKEQHFHCPADAMKAGLSYLSEDRQGTAILTGASVEWNTTLSSLSRYCRWLFIRKKECRNAAGAYAEKFETKMNSTADLLCHLSGGNQQKVAIAKGLDTQPDIFIFDEPTRGVDVGARGDIYRLIHELADRGISCLLISSDLQEIIGNCNRVLVMRDGCLAGEVRDDQVNEKEMMYLATGVKK